MTKYFAIEPTTVGPDHPNRVDPYTLFCYQQDGIVHRYPMTFDDIINLGIALNLFYADYLTPEQCVEANLRVDEAMAFNKAAAEL
jgi:hypothetical protein